MLLSNALAITTLAMSQADIPNGIATPLGRMLTQQGYVAMPMARLASYDLFTVPCRIGSESFRMLVDTGAESSCIDPAVAVRLGLTLGTERKVQGVGGLASQWETTLPDQMAIGRLETQDSVGLNSISCVEDLSAFNERFVKNKLVPIGGVLGHGGLKLFSAVIDYPTKTLYLRSPLTGLWPTVAGEWVAVRTEQDGEKCEEEPATRHRLVFENRQLTILEGDRGVTFNFQVMPGEEAMILYLYKPEMGLKKPRLYNGVCVMTVADGKLKICMLVNPQNTRGRASEFTTGPGGGRMLFDCVRTKPKP